MENIKRQYIRWVLEHPNFKKDEFSMPYIDIVRRMLECPCITEEYIKRSFMIDIRHMNKVDYDAIAIKQIEKEAMAGIDLEGFAFVTIGYNEQTINPAKMKEIEQKLRQQSHWSSVESVHEKHRENGIHHHTHFLIRWKGNMYKSKIIQYIYQIKGIKKYVLSKAFIDVKMQDGVSYEDRLKYIKGDKTESKLQYVEKDIEWRKINNL